MAACTVCELHAESTFKIEGMDCREEVAMLERRFKNVAGLEDFSADLIGSVGSLHAYIRIFVSFPQSVASFGWISYTDKVFVVSRIFSQFFSR